MEPELVPALGTWEAVDSIRVVRQFSDRPISDAALARIMNAARRAGSSKNLQRWAYVVCRDRAHLAELATLGPWAGHLAGRGRRHRPGHARSCVTADAPLSVMFDLGRAAQNMVLTAWELGIGSVPATVYEHDRARELLGYPADWHCEYLLSFGYPADESLLTAPKRPGKRRALAEIVHAGALVGRALLSSGRSGPRSRSRPPASLRRPRRRPRAGRRRAPRP